MQGLLARVVRDREEGAVPREQGGVKFAHENFVGAKSARAAEARNKDEG